VEWLKAKSSTTVSLQKLCRQAAITARLHPFRDKSPKNSKHNTKIGYPVQNNWPFNARRTWSTWTGGHRLLHWVKVSCFLVCWKAQWICHKDSGVETETSAVSVICWHQSNEDVRGMEFKSRKMVVISFWVRTRMQIEFRQNAWVLIVRRARTHLSNLSEWRSELRIAKMVAVWRWQLPVWLGPTGVRYRSTQPSACSIILPSFFEGSKLHSSVGWEPPKLPTGNDWFWDLVGSRRGRAVTKKIHMPIKIADPRLTSSTALASLELCFL